MSVCKKLKREKNNSLNDFSRSNGQKNSELELHEITNRNSTITVKELIKILLAQNAACAQS